MNHKISFGLLLLASGTLLMTPPASSQNFVDDAAAPWPTPAPSARLNSRLMSPLSIKQAEPAVSGDRAALSVMKDSPTREETTSFPLEEMYSARVIDQLSQFGYDIFKRTSPQNSSDIPTGAAQDDFVLSIGDELSIVLRGQRQTKMTSQINGEGLLIIEDIEPVMAAGRTLRQVREQIESSAAQLYNTEAFVSLVRVNQINVTVIGDVREPGRKTLTSFDTVLDALAASGGITKNGTLRQVKLIRDGRAMMIDLYGLLIYGSDTTDLALRNGDKLMIRPLGPTVAIAGGVKRPGIYEILPALHGNWSNPETKSQKLSLNDLLDMSGGVLSTAQNRYIRMDMSGTGQEHIEDVTDPMARVFGDGDILMVERGKERREGTVELMGAAHTAGIHALDETASLAALLTQEATLPRETYPLIGAIERWNKNGLTRELIAFPPMLVMSGDYDRKLLDGDIVHLFPHKQVASLQKSQSAAAALEPVAMGDSETEDADLDPLLADFLRERSVFVRGAVRQPGAYPVSAGATLENILAMAGGPSIEANTKNIEISRAIPSDGKTSQLPAEQRRLAVNLSQTSPSTIALGAGDTVRINQKYKRVEDNHVLLIGEIANPGTYDVMPGDTLGSLLARAGGLTEQAYADGAIFSRVSERKREEARFKSQARDLEMRLAARMEEEDEEKKPNPREISSAKDLISQLRLAEGLGRITVEADPAVLAEKQELDILLESGDRIYIPKRPMTVRVAGEVLSPVALQFRSGTSPSTYITQAGGYTYNADKGRAFIVYPDGSARPLGSSWSGNGYGGNLVPAGSTIVVPRDPKPFDFMDTAKDLTQILANLATTAIFATAISDEN